MYRLNISPNDLTPEIFFSGSLRLTHSFLPSVRGSLVAHVLVDHGLPDALVAIFPHALICAALRMSLESLPAGCTRECASCTHHKTTLCASCESCVHHYLLLDIRNVHVAE